MIASIATAVLPVWRSPMISSRWPRPMGIMPSIAFSPVWSGCFTGWRATLLGALSSMRRRSLPSLAQRIHHPADQLFADRHFGDAAGALDRVAFFDHVGFAEERRADVVFFQVEGDAENIVRKLEQLAGGDLVEAVDARDAVAGGQHRADFLDLDGLFVVADLFFDDAADLGRADFH